MELPEKNCWQQIRMVFLLFMRMAISVKSIVLYAMLPEDAALGMGNASPYLGIRPNLGNMSSGNAA